MKSLDPRVNRLDLEQQIGLPDEVTSDSYEVFHQEKRGKQHVHVGAVRANNAELAMIYAKEQYARRKTCSNLWVVKTADIFTLKTEDEDIFETVPDKLYREASIYKVREKIDAYKSKTSKAETES